MRTGSEQFILKDFPFYDSMAAPVVGVTAVFIYELLRRHVWRSTARGSDRSRSAFGNGKLCASISRKRLALMSGVSVRQVQYDINRLRDIGWVRSKNGRWTGETLLYELGYRDRQGSEMFYADGDLRELHLRLEELEGEARFTDEERLELAKGWFGDAKARGVVQEMHYPDGSSAQPALPTDGGSAEPALCHRESYGVDESEKAGNIDRALPRASDSQEPGPLPKTFSQRANTSEPRSHDKRRKRARVGSSDTGRTEQDERGIGTFALDKEPGDRFEAAAQAVDEGRKKADNQVEADAERLRRKLQAGRERKVQEKQANEQRARNLKGRMPLPDVYRECTRLWSVLQDLLEEFDPDFPRTDWKAEANKKARGQMRQLVELYGGAQTEQALVYTVRNWNRITDRYFKKGSKGVPNLGALFALHESLYREAVLWAKHSGAIREWEEWREENPDDFYPPNDLKERYQKATKELEALGF